MIESMERKSFDIEIKAEDLAKGRVSGYAAVFNVRDRHGDIIVPTAFNRTVERTKGKVPLLAEHDLTVEIGYTTSLLADEYGLKYEAQLYISDDPQMDLPEARAMWIKLQRRQEAGLPMKNSIGFRTKQEEFDRDKNARLIKEVELVEVSMVARPANDLAGVLSLKNESDLRRVLLDVMRMTTLEEKAGAVLSKANRKLLQEAIASLQAVLDQADKSDSRKSPSDNSDGEKKAADTDPRPAPSVQLDEVKAIVAQIRRNAGLSD